MFVFDLFEKKKKDDTPRGFVGGKSNIASVKRAIDRAYQENPGAKNDFEAMAGHIDKVDSLNAQQSKELAQQEKENRQQSTQINQLAKDLKDKESRFRELTAQMAQQPGMTPQQQAAAAQELEKSHDAGAPEKPADIVSRVAQTKPKTTVAKPEPGASIGQLAQYAKAKQQGAVDATPTKQATVAPTTTTAPAPQTTPAPAAKAFGQMATQLTQPQSRVYKAKQPAQQELPVNVTAMPSTPASQQRLQQLAGAGFPSMDAANAGAYKQYATEATSPADLQAIAQHNNQSFSQAWAHSQSTKLYFGNGQWEDLTFQEIEQMVSAIATDYTEQARPQVWQQLFTDHNYFNEFKAQHLSQMPLQFSEGDVVPMTQDQSVLQAYNDVLEILKASKTKQPDVVTMMRQDWASRYKQRFQISTAPDGTYYMLDKTTNQRHRLPDPRTFPMEEDSWHDGQDSWSSEHDQWAKESVEQQYSVTGNALHQSDLQVGDPIIVKGKNEFHGLPGRLSEFSPSGRFVIVDLYNHGMHSMNLADIRYDEETAKTDPKDDYWNENAVDETIRKLGNQYRLYSGKGKNLGTFPTKAGAEKHEREVQYFKHAGEGVEEGWFFKSPEEKEKADKQLNAKMKENIDVAISQLIPALIEKITYNQFEGTGTDWFGIRSRVFSGLRILDNSIKPELKKVSDSITAKLKAFGTNPALDASKADLFSLNPFKDSTKEYRLKFNQQMMMDKDYILKLLNQYLLLLNKSIEQGVEEGYQDFNKVEPYAVCLAGKPVKQFDYYEQARQFHDNWKQKLYREGNTEKADKITLMPLNLDEAGSPAQQAAIAVAMKKAGKKPKNESDDGDWVDDPNTHAQVNRSGFNKLTPQSYADKIDFIDRQLADPRQQQNWPEFKQRRLDLVFAAQRAGIIKEFGEAKAKKQRLDPKCWKGYHKAGTKVKGGVRVNNCVKNESVNYWEKLKEERNTKIKSLVDELDVSIKDIK